MFEEHFYSRKIWQNLKCELNTLIIKNQRRQWHNLTLNTCNFPQIKNSLSFADFLILHIHDTKRFPTKLAPNISQLELCLPCRASDANLTHLIQLIKVFSHIWIWKRGALDQIKLCRREIPPQAPGLDVIRPTGTLKNDSELVVPSGFPSARGFQSISLRALLCLLTKWR